MFYDFERVPLDCCCNFSFVILSTKFGMVSGSRGTAVTYDYCDKQSVNILKPSTLEVLWSILLAQFDKT